MAEDLKWIFELIDRVSVPAKQMQAELNKVKEALHKSEDESKKATSLIGKNFQKLGEEIYNGAFGGIVKGTFLVEAIKKVGELGEKLVELGYDFGKEAVAAADFEDRAKIAFETLLGSAEKADAVLSESKLFAFKAALPLQDVIRDYQQLLLAKIKPIDIPVALQGLQDLNIMKGGTNAELAGLVDTIARIGQTGELTGRELRPLAVIGEDLAKKLGKADFKDLQKDLEEHGLPAAQALQAIFETIAAKEGGTLGRDTLKVADTVGGSIQRIKTGWEIMLGSLDEAPEFAGFRTALAGIAELFDTTTPKGKELQSELNAVLTTGIKMATELLEHKGDIADFFKDGLDTAKSLLDTVEKLTRFFRNGLEIKIDSSGLDIGVATDKEAAGGRFGSGPGLLGTSTGETDSYLPHGHFASGGHVDEPTFAIVGEGGEGESIVPDSKAAEFASSIAFPSPTAGFAFSGAGDGGRGDVSITPRVDVHVSLPEKHREEDLQDFVQRLEETLPTDLQNGIEQIAIETGVS